MCLVMPFAPPVLHGRICVSGNYRPVEFRGLSIRHATMRAYISGLIAALSNRSLDATETLRDLDGGEKLSALIS